MKKNLGFQTLMLLILSCVACQRQADQALLETGDALFEKQAQMTINATIEGEGGTRTSLGGGSSLYYPLWSENDQIAVYSGAGSPAMYTLQSGAGSREATFGGDQLTGSVVGLYPYSAATAGGFSNHVLTLELPSEQQYVQGSFGAGAYPMIAVSSLSSDLTFKNLCAILRVSLIGSDPVKSIRFHAHAENRFVSGKATVRTDFETVPELVMSSGGSQDVTLLCDNVSLDPETPTEFFLVIPPGTYTGGFDLVISSTTGDMSRSTDADITFERSQYRSVPTFAFVPEEQPGLSGIVDMGLSVMWATCNLGASSPEEYGNYYAWGEAKPKDSFSPFYSWFANGSLKNITKYCYDPSCGYNGNTDYLVYLQPEDDAAHCELGDQWRIPTKGEVEELIQNTSMTKTTQNGVDGFDLVSQVNGNHLFIPAAGYKLGDVVYRSGQEGEFWTADLGTEQPFYAGIFLLRETQKQITEDLRYIGNSIRPVYGDPIKSVFGVSLNRTRIDVMAGDRQTLIAAVTPSDAYFSKVRWSSSDTTIAAVSSSGVVLGLKEGSAWITATTMDGGNTASCEVVVRSAMPLKEPEVVDLGLSVKWASFNLGASRPEEYGDYYAWGEIRPYYSILDPLTWRSGKENGYAWGSYRLNPSGDGTNFTKYSGGDYSTLQRGDDAATCNLGDSWRMPTIDEWLELRNTQNCDWTWMEDYQGSGQNGYLVTSKKEGFTDRSIFLPAAGHWSGINQFGLGTRGEYWSSSLKMDSDRGYCYAYSPYFRDGFINWSGSYRYDGNSIRPVYNDNFTPDANKCIVYTSTDGKVVTPSNTSAFGANIVSNEYANGTGIITFDSDVKTIGDQAFNLCSTLSGIIIPEGAKSIGYAAFAGCHELASISIPEGITSIGAHAFESCNVLTEVVIPESLTIIADRAFQFCHALTSVSIPAKVRSIGVEAFIACESLSSITVAGGNKVYDSRNNCNAIIETSTNTLIAGCQNTVIPQSVVRINDNAFYASLNMTQVVIPEGVKTIGYRTFAHCYALTSVSIPATMESIGGLAFETNSSLTQMIVFALVPPSVESNILSNSYNCKIYVPAGSLDGYKTASGWSTYANRIFPIEEISISVPEVVDLGLSVKWASFNLGAARPEEFGDYFAWGETEPKDTYSWTTYKWCNGSYNKLTKYCPADKSGYWDGVGIPDEKTLLDMEDDAACAKWSGAWRLPTDSEWTELRENCTWTHTVQNKTIGYLVTGPNGNSIFLPEAGCHQDDNFNDANVYGYYRSSALYSNYPYFAWFVYFSRDGVFRDYGHYRTLGFSIRAVYDDN